MSKRILTLALIAALVGVVSVGAQAKPRDGFYYAEEAEYQASGWKGQVVLEVKGGRIVAANWNATNNKGIQDKKTESAAGRYGMAKASKLGKEWHEQAAVVEKYLIDNQDVNFSRYKDAGGTTDAISGASVKVKEFFDLAKAALAAGPVARGSYKKDGWFYAKAPSFDRNGFASTALVTIVNGRIVNANWNALHKDGGDSKFVRAQKGTYKMNAKQGEWHVQAPRVEAALIAQQDPAKISVKTDGKTDAVSGVSITIGEFITVANEALKAAR